MGEDMEAERLRGECIVAAMAGYLEWLVRLGAKLQLFELGFWSRLEGDEAQDRREAGDGGGMQRS